MTYRIKIKECLREADRPLAPKEINNHVNGNMNRVYEVLKDMRENGTVQRDEKQGWQYSTYYRLATVSE